MSTIWTDPSDNNTDWRTDFTTGRHTYGADVGTGLRIVYGDHVRYGGTANLDTTTTVWQNVSSNSIVWS